MKAREGSAINMFIFVSLLANEVERADAKHGDWKGKTKEEMIAHVADEFAELMEAIQKDDLHGEHGIYTELIQVVCTLYKMWRTL